VEWTIGADPVGSRGPDPTSLVVRVFYGSNTHEKFTEVNLVSAKSTPRAAL